MVDLRAISFGAGWQSTVLALMLSEDDPRLAALGYTRPDCAIFADTGGEPGYIYDHLDWIEGQLSFPVHRVMRANLKDNLMARRDLRGRQFVEIPVFTWNKRGEAGMAPRYCSVEYKVKPIRHKMRELVGRRGTAESWLGITIDEAHRMKDTKLKWLTNRYPLVDLGMTRRDCHDWFRERYPGRTISKSACTFCPFRSAGEWREMERRSPSSMEEAVAVDLQVREARKVGTSFLHRSRRPLGDVMAEANQQAELDLFGQECDGVCDV